MRDSAGMERRDDGQHHATQEESLQGLLNDRPGGHLKHSCRAAAMAGLQTVSSAAISHVSRSRNSVRLVAEDAASIGSGDDVAVWYTACTWAAAVNTPKGGFSMSAKGCSHPQNHRWREDAIHPNNKITVASPKGSSG